MRPDLETAEWPADAVEVGRIADAWGVKGWFKVIPHSASPEALFSCRRWVLMPPERAGKASATASGAQAWTQPLMLRIQEVREHADTLVAHCAAIADRKAAEGLKGARVYVPRSSFPTPQEGEYYWVDLIGLQVVNREGLALGEVRDLMSTGPQTVLVLKDVQEGKAIERMIPFVSTFVDKVDTAARCITVDWQPDY